MAKVSIYPQGTVGPPFYRKPSLTIEYPLRQPPNSPTIAPIGGLPVDQANRCHRAVVQQMQALLVTCCDSHRFRSRMERYFHHAALLAAEDLHALASRDPSAHGSWRYVLRSYTSFHAVLSYRLAHALLTTAAGMSRRTAPHVEATARSISEQAKVNTGVEIHPAARIGRRFVLDHATGTVIGETTVIGDDCYLLQGVILGALGIACNPTGKRHPTIGSRVEIGAFVRALGAIQIGDDVKIAPASVVCHDVPTGSRIRVITQYQIADRGTEFRIFGVVPRSSNEFEVHGSGLSCAKIKILEDRIRERRDQTAIVQTVNDRLLRCRVANPLVLENDGIAISTRAGQRVLIHQLSHVWQQMKGMAK